jgi:hypothetical protein
MSGYGNIDPHLETETAGQAENVAVIGEEKT